MIAVVPSPEPVTSADLAALMDMLAGIGTALAALVFLAAFGLMFAIARPGGRSRV